MVKEISREQLKNLIDNKGDYILIDVRDKDELKNGMIPTAHHIPLDELQDALDLDPEEFIEKYGFAVTQGDRLIFHCKLGGRSEKATELAVSLGFQAENFAGSVKEWSEIDPDVKMYD